MKREELEYHWLEKAFCQGDTKAYYKEDADSVMDAMEAKIKELEGIKHADMVRIAELEAEVIGYKASLERANFKALEKNARLKAQVPKWISVKDMLPPKNKEFIGCSIKGSVCPCWLQFPEHAIDYLAYWMPLPLPPTTTVESATEKN